MAFHKAAKLSLCGDDAALVFTASWLDDRYALNGEAITGQVLGLTKTQTFFRVVLLQVIKRIVPPMSNEIITLVKDTSLARIIALQEIIWAGQAFMKGSHGISGAIWPMFFTMVYYLFASGILTVLLGRLEKKLSFFKV